MEVRGEALRMRETPGFVIRTVSYGPGELQQRHAHRQTSVSFVVRGSLEESVGGTTETAGPLSVVVKPAGVEHSNCFGPDGATTLQVELRRSFLCRWGSREFPLSSWRWIHGTAGPFGSLLHTVRLDGRDEACLENAVLEALASLADRSKGTTSRIPDPPLWLRLVSEEIEQRFADKLRVGELADTAGVHPVVLARNFRRHYGTSITSLVKRRRVRAAAELLSRSDLALSSVAYSTGFSDQSHLCRVFRSATGVTPGIYRTLTTS